MLVRLKNTNLCAGLQPEFPPFETALSVWVKFMAIILESFRKKTFPLGFVGSTLDSSKVSGQ